MRPAVLDFARDIAEHFPRQEPVVEFGARVAEGQEGLADLRSLFGAVDYIGCDIQEGPGVDRIEDLHALTFADGSVGTIVYTTGGAAHGPKERLMVSGRGVLADLLDYRYLRIWSGRRRRTFRLRRQDKGHGASLKAWINAIRTGSGQAVPVADIIAATEATICMDEAVREGRRVDVRVEEYLARFGTPAG